LGEHVKYKTWNLAINSVGQALNAIEVLSKRKLYKFLKENDDKGIKYRVLINGRDFLCEKTPTLNDPESIANSELCAQVHGLKTIDIVPVLEGAGGNGASIGAIILGVVLVIVGIVVAVAGGGLGVPLIIAGIGLIAAGVINLLSKGPELQEFTQRQKTSYLFGGPVNTINEGGPVPVQYGMGMIGSSVISASYDVEYFNADDTARIT
jgi:predicted phage tail protein